MNDKRILVVDDETDLLEMVKSIFTRAGFTQILTASSGEAALKMCEEQEPDMMIYCNCVLCFCYKISGKARSNIKPSCL